MQITLTIDLTAENLEKLKVFCEETGAAPKAKPAPKQKVAPAAKPEPKQEAPTEESPKENTAEQAAPAKAITLTDVRAVALKISKAGKSDVLKEIFAKFDATKLSEVPEDKYGDLMKELVAVNA